MKAAKTVFLCSNCGNETPRWQGRCPSCGQWNTLEEYTPPQAAAPSRSSLTGRTSAARGVGVQPKRLNEVTSGEELRFGTGLSELDRVLGGGAVRGSLVLVSGAPGIGKSTLLLQICAQICREQTILYVSGEESENQLKLRAERLGVQSDALWLLCETSLDEILAAAERMQPGLLIVDSIQTLYTEDKTSSPGSIAQVRDCTMRLMQYSKRCGVTVFVVGHINKEGAIAGPKVLEHMVDCVLYFEGEEHTTYRLLRAAKNRFGSTNEIGVFEMDDRGLREVPNPSELLLAGRPLGTPGTCVACVMEGTRPVLAEVQALVCQTTYNMPRRTSNGYDYNRAAMLLAVLAAANLLLLWMGARPTANQPPAAAYRAVGADLAALGSDMGAKGDFLHGKLDEVESLLRLENYFRDSAYGNSVIQQNYREENAELFDQYEQIYRNKSYTLYTDSLTIEYRLFTQLVNEYDTVAGYTDFLDSVQTKANQLSGISIFQNDETGYDLKSIEVTAAVYAGLDETAIDYYPQKGLYTAISYTFTDLILLASILVLALLLVRQERDSGLLSLVRSLPAGRLHTALAKLGSFALSLLAVLVLLYGVNLAYCAATFGLGPLSRTIQSVPALMRCTMQITVGECIPSKG